MNDAGVDAYADAMACLADCVAVLNGREIDAVELLRYTYYYSVTRREREEEAMMWLKKNRPDMAQRVSPPGSPRIGGRSDHDDEVDLVNKAIQLADQATKVQAAARGKFARNRPKKDDNMSSRMGSIWSIALAEQRHKDIEKLQVELKNTQMEVRHLQKDVARLEAENVTLETELSRRIAELAAGKAGVEDTPQFTVQERINALAWLGKTRSQYTVTPDPQLRTAKDRVGVLPDADLQAVVQENNAEIGNLLRQLGVKDSSSKANAKPMEEFDAAVCAPAAEP